MIEHRLHHMRRPASGTGTHNHHRARLEHRGDSVGYWRCGQGIAPTFACPDEPDPWVRLSEKAAARRKEEMARIKPARDRCRYGHGAEHQTRNAQGSAFCKECQRLAGLRSRMKRAATSIVAAALAA